jgi:CCR4-NOT transcription complex subunit 1
MIMTLELIKNEKYHFFELPFIKATPEVCRYPMRVGVIEC